MAVTISITNQPNQRFSVIIPLEDGRNLPLDFFICFNPIRKYWQMSLTRSDTREEIISNLSLVRCAPLGLLDAFGYMDIGNAYIVPLSSNAPDFPGMKDWGSQFSLVWV